MLAPPTHTHTQGHAGLQTLPHLVLLLEAVPFGTLHLRDVLQQVGHSDGRVQLTCLVGQCLPLRLPLLVVGLDQATGFTGHSVAVIWRQNRRQSMTVGSSDQGCRHTDVMRDGWQAQPEQIQFSWD